MAEGKVVRYILCKLDDREYAAGDTYEGSPERVEELTRLGYLAGSEDAEDPAGEEDLEESAATPEKKNQRGKRGSANGAD